MTAVAQGTSNAIRPFHVDVPDEALTELRRRIDATRWPTRELVTDRSQGVQLATMKELCRYWTTEYDWRRCEARRWLRRRLDVAIVPGEHGSLALRATDRPDPLPPG